MGKEAGEAMGWIGVCLCTKPEHACSELNRKFEAIVGKSTGESGADCTLRSLEKRENSQAQWFWDLWTEASVRDQSTVPLIAQERVKANEEEV